jgi:hypothetical protein
MSFQQYLKRTLTIMDMQKKQVKLMSEVRDKQDKAQGDLLLSLMKFEDVGLAYYGDGDDSKRILTHPSSSNLKERVEENSVKWKNPYKEAYLWIKGEFLDVQGMYETLLGREHVMKA